MKLALALAFVTASVVAPPRAGDAPIRALAELASDRPVAVVVVKSTTCPACAAQMGSLAGRVDDVRATGGEVTALLADEPADVRAWAAKLALPFSFRTVADDRVLRDAGFWMADAGQPLPGVVFLDRCGTIRDVVRGRGPGASQDRIILDTLRRLAAERPICAGRV